MCTHDDYGMIFSTIPAECVTRLTEAISNPTADSSLSLDEEDCACFLAVDEEDAMLFDCRYIDGTDHTLLDDWQTCKDGESVECNDFATSENEAQALGDLGCLVSYSGWDSSEYCGLYYAVSTCTHERWGEAYSECCPEFCGVCNDNAQTIAPSSAPTLADCMGGIGDGRCGPSFDNKICTSASPYCNEENGWCGNTDAHMYAQPSTTYDYNPLCLNSDFFTMSGDCDVQGDCVSSRYYPEIHTNNERCTVTMNRDASVSPGATFSLETCCDHLMIGGVDVESSSAVPATLSAGDVFTWYSDFSISREGWQLCFSENDTDVSTISPTSSNDSASMLTILTGGTDVEMTVVVVGDSNPVLTVNSGSFQGSWETLDEGVEQFSDRHYVLTYVPDSLIGALYYKGPCRSYGASISVETSGSVYVLASDGNGEEAIDAFVFDPPAERYQFITGMLTTSFPQDTGFIQWTFFSEEYCTIEFQGTPEYSSEIGIYEFHSIVNNRPAYQKFGGGYLFWNANFSIWIIGRELGISSNITIISEDNATSPELVSQWSAVSESGNWIVSNNLNATCLNYCQAGVRNDKFAHLLPGGHGVCCSLNCDGICGGDGCENRHGGASECCTRDIVDSGVLCEFSTDSACIISGCLPGSLLTQVHVFDFDTLSNISYDIVQILGDIHEQYIQSPDRVVMPNSNSLSLTHCFEKHKTYEIGCYNDYDIGFGGGYITIAGVELCKEFRHGSFFFQQFRVTNEGIFILEQLENVTHSSCENGNLIDIQLLTGTAFSSIREIGWEINSECFQDSFVNTGTQKQCCLPDGIYSITCSNTFGHGWQDASLQVGESTFCLTDHVTDCRAMYDTREDFCGVGDRQVSVADASICAEELCKSGTIATWAIVLLTDGFIEGTGYGCNVVPGSHAQVTSHKLCAPLTGSVDGCDDEAMQCHRIYIQNDTVREIDWLPFQVHGDGCQVDSNCVHTTLFPENSYKNNEECHILFTWNVEVRVDALFRIERCCDELKILSSENEFLIESRENIPRAIANGSIIHWKTDSSITREGWKLCFEHTTNLFLSPNYNLFGMCSSADDCFTATAGTCTVHDKNSFQFITLQPGDREICLEDAFDVDTELSRVACIHTDPEICMRDDRCGWSDDGACHTCANFDNQTTCSRKGCLWLASFFTCKGSCQEFPKVLLLGNSMSIVNVANQWECQHQCMIDSDCRDASFIFPSICYTNDQILSFEENGIHGLDRFITFNCKLDNRTQSPTLFPSTGPTSLPSRSPSKVPTPLMYPSGLPTVGPITSGPSSSPTTATPSTHPTTSIPTESPLFSSSDCIDIVDCSNEALQTTDTIELGLTAEQACCRFGGGKIQLSDHSTDINFFRNIASDLEFNIDFTYSFWVHITPSQDTKHIIQLTYDVPVGELQERQRVDAVQFIRIENQRVIISLVGATPSDVEERRYMSEELPLEYFYCESPNLSSTNDEYLHYNSIHFVHHKNLQRFVLYLNGAEYECPWSEHASLLHSNYSIEVVSFGLGIESFGDLIFTRHAFSVDEVDYFTREHLSSFPRVVKTAWFVVIFAGSVTFTIIVWASIGWQAHNADRPDFIAIFSVGLGILDITSDWQLTYELRSQNHPLWLPSFLFCVIPAIAGLLYFVYWYRTYTGGEEGDVLRSWLLKYRVPFFALMILSSSNLGFFNILWSRCNALHPQSYELFNIPLTHQQQVSLMRGKVLNVIFEEVPLFFIQSYVLFGTDISSNSNDLNSNSELAVTISTISTVLGFLMNGVQFCATREDIGESKMRQQHIIVQRPTQNLMMISHKIADCFRENYHASKVFVWCNDNATEYMLKFYHNHPNEHFALQRIAQALEQYLDDNSKMYALPNNRTLKLIENMLDLNLCVDNGGTFEIAHRGGKHRLYLEYSVSAKESLEEFTKHFNEKVLGEHEEFEYGMQYPIELIRNHFRGSALEKPRLSTERKTLRVAPEVDEQIDNDNHSSVQRCNVNHLVQHIKEAGLRGSLIIPHLDSARTPLSKLSSEWSDAGELSLWKTQHPFAQDLTTTKANWDHQISHTDTVASFTETRVDYSVSSTRHPSGRTLSARGVKWYHETTRADTESFIPEVIEFTTGSPNISNRSAQRVGETYHSEEIELTTAAPSRIDRLAQKNFDEWLAPKSDSEGVVLVEHCCTDEPDNTGYHNFNNMAMEKRGIRLNDQEHVFE